VTTTREARLLKESDDAQADYALAEARVVFTQDRDILRINASSRPHAGIVYCRQGRRSIGELIQGLVEIWEIMEPEEMKNFVVYL
jgi:hypothetical protein